MSKKWISLLLSLTLLLSLCAGSAGADSTKPLSFSTQTLSGESFSSSIMKNYDVVMINVWAEWCGPCMSELPDLEKIHQNYPNVLLIGAYVDENYSGARRAAANAGVTYPLIKFPYALYDYLKINGSSFSIPQTCFFDRNGYLMTDAYVGSRNYSSWAHIVDQMLKAVSSAEQVKNGLCKDSDGVFRYYENNNFVAKTGIVDFEGGRFFVANGVLCSDVNGLAEYGGQWYFLSGGQIQDQYTGLALYNDHWFYVANGRFNPNLNGLVNYNGSLFVVAAGEMIPGVNGLWQNTDGTWYFLSNSQVQSNYRGLALYDGHWFYVWDGVFQDDAEGWVEHDGHSFYVINGQVF